MPSHPKSTELTSHSVRRRRLRRLGPWLSKAFAIGTGGALLLLVLLWLGDRSGGGAGPGSDTSGARSLLARMAERAGLDARRSRAAAPGATALGEHGSASGAPPRVLEGAGSALPTSTAQDASGRAGSVASEPAAATDGNSAGASSNDEEPPRDARVSGRVVDATGGPVAGATVRVRFIERALAQQRKTGKFTFSFSQTPDAEWIADTQGQFEGLAPVGRISLAVSVEAYTEAREIVRAPARDVVLVLAPGASVTGRVQRADGSPVSGATLQLKPRGFEPLPIEGTSDERGEFSIGGVPAGVVEVTASAPGLSTAREWLRLTLAELAAPLVFTLEAAHSIYGVVRGPDGRPCTAGMVRMGGRLSRMATIDAQGSYRSDGLDVGTHELTVNCPGVGMETRSILVAADSPPNIELNWQLAASFSLAGSVHRKNGEPMVGAMVWVYAVAAPEGSLPTSKTDAFVGNTGASCNTDAAGEFQCGGLQAGWYRANTGAPSVVTSSSDPMRVDAETKARVELVIPDSGEVRVRTADTGDKGGLLSHGVFARGGSQAMPIPAAPSGDLFVFEDLALGRYRIAVGRATSEPGPSAVDVELTQPGQVIEVELRAPEAMVIGGAVVDPNGAPVPDAWVKASVSEPGFSLLQGAAAPVLTNADGRFEIKDLAPGRYAVTAKHAGGEAEGFDVSAGQRDVRLVIKGYGSLSGRVRGVDGKPARHFSVVVIRDTPGEPLNVDGDRGRWSLPWVVPGEYRVVFMSPSGGAWANARVTSGTDTELAAELDPALAGQAILNVMKRPR